MGTIDKLIKHRKILAENPDAYVYELQDNHIDRLVTTLIRHLKDSGYVVSFKKYHSEITRIIRLLFEAQECRPFFHIEGTELPLCWNTPGDWDLDYIKYEWGHLKSKNQSDEDVDALENLGLYSARCNRHIQTSMNIQELMVYGGILAQRISNVLTARRKLFISEEWKVLSSKLGYRT